MQERAKWFATFIKHLGETQGQFGAHFAVDQSTVSRWVRGAKPDIEHWDAIKRFAGEMGYPLPETESGETVNIIGYVGAGAVIFPIDDHPQGGGFDTIQAPLGTGPAIALIVRGDSQYPVYRDGDVIVLENMERDPRDLIGEMCFVKLADGQALLKELAPGRTPKVFRLKSHNAPDMEDVAVERAYPVSWVKPGQRAKRLYSR